MKVKLAYYYELKPNVAQRIHLARHAGTARFAFNWGLKERIALYELQQKSTNAIEQHRALNRLKSTEFPWMYEVSKCAPQEALRDLDRAFKNFFQGRKRKQHIGFPKPKKKGVHDSFRLTGTIRVRGNTVQLPSLGVLRLKETSNVQGRILSATVSRRADRWFVSLTVEQDRPDPLPVHGEVVGIDMGLSCFAALSTGEKRQAPKPLKKSLKRLKRLSQQHSKKQKGSRNRKKSQLKLAKKHAQIRNIRRDSLHKISTELAKTKSVIIVEGLNIQGMVRNSKLSRHISDAGWGEFRRMLEYKTKWYGSKLIVTPQFYPSSKLCSACGVRQAKMPLSVREWCCPSCNTVHDRDINAALNLVHYYNTGSSSEIYACGDTSDGTGLQPVSYVSLRQEVTNGIFVHKL